jgi:hypothetical protein
MNVLLRISSLIMSDNIQSCFIILDKYINCYTKILMNHHKDPINHELEGYDKILLQTVLSKAMNLKNILSGVSFQDDVFRIENFIDPVVLTTVARNLFETVCTFETLNIVPQSQEQKELIFTLFLISGYKNRQNFNYSELEDDLKQQAVEEARMIENYTQNIHESNLYQSLSLDSQHRIDNAIKNYKYRFYFNENNEVVKLDWEEVLPHVGIQGSLLRKIYAQLSIHAHPSFISVMQFGQMFELESQQYINSSTVCMRHCFFFLNIFLMDYMKLFPQIMNTYHTLPEEDMALFEMHYKMVTTVFSDEDLTF